MTADPERSLEPPRRTGRRLPYAMVDQAAGPMQARIAFTCTRAERNRLIAAAASAQLSLSQFCRQKLMDALL